MKFTEIELQEYRRLICSEDISAMCEGCKKTKEDIKECYWENLRDLETCQS